MTSNLRVPRVNTLLYSFIVPFSILRLMTSTFNHTITGHCSYMSDNETKEDTSTPTMTKEEGFRACVDKLDFWDDMPMFIRVLSETLSRGSRTRGKKWSQLSDQRKSRLRTVLTQVTNMVCCGEFKEFIQDYASHSTFIGPAAEDDGQCPDCANVGTTPFGMGQYGLGGG